MWMQTKETNNSSVVFCSFYSSLSRTLFGRIYTYQVAVRFPLEETTCLGLLFNNWDWSIFFFLLGGSEEHATW